MKSNPKRKSKPKPKPPLRSKNKLNFTVIAIFLVILGSIGSGIAAAFLFYKLGRQSLSTVTTPSENPTQKIKQGKSETTNREFKIIEEREILVRVYDFVHQQKEENKGQPPS